MVPVALCLSTHRTRQTLIPIIGTETAQGRMLVGVQEARQTLIPIIGTETCVGKRAGVVNRCSPNTNPDHRD